VKVDTLRLGMVVRTVRMRLGLRQVDVAKRADVSASTVSRIERGHIGALSVDVLMSVAGTLGFAFTLSLVGEAASWTD
jgi:transcriptional regulator with XRE-family HTH domain